MSLPDGAEYWQDVKASHYHSKHVFTHIPGIQCGHFHVDEGIEPESITCNTCKTLLNERPVEMMVLMAEKKAIEQVKEQRRHNNKVKKLKQKLRKKAQHGVCSCGYPFMPRTNSANGNNFLGCWNFPVCKNTKPL